MIYEPKKFNNRYDMMQFLDSLSPKEIEEFLRLDRETKELEKENREIAERQTGSYEDSEKRTAEMQEYFSNESILNIRNKDLISARQRIEKLQKSIAQVGERQADLNSYEASINGDREVIERKMASNISLSLDEQNDLAGIEQALQYIRITGMKSENEINALQKKIEAFNRRISRFSEEIEKLNVRQNEIRENQKNGYIDLEAKKSDEETLSLNNALIGANCNRIEEITKTPAKKILSNLYSVEALVGSLRVLNPGVEIRMGNPALDSISNDRIYCSVPVSQLRLPTGFAFNDKNGLTNKHHTESGAYIAVNVEDLSKANPATLLSEEKKGNDDLPTPGIKAPGNDLPIPGKKPPVVPQPGDRRVSRLKQLINRDITVKQFMSFKAQDVKNFLTTLIKGKEEPYDAARLSPLYGTGFDPYEIDRKFPLRPDLTVEAPIKKKKEEPYDAARLSPLYGTGYDPEATIDESITPEPRTR